MPYKEDMRFKKKNIRHNETGKVAMSARVINSTAIIKMQSVCFPNIKILANKLIKQNDMQRRHEFQKD